MSTIPTRSSPYTAVIFDVDGTLVDSERDGHRVAFNLAFEEAGLPDRWDVDLYGELLETTGGQRRLSRYFLSRGYSERHSDLLAERLHRRKTAMMRDLIDIGAVPLRPGVRRLVEELEASGIELYVATTGNRAWVEPLLELHFGLDRFAGIVTGTEITTLKPDPAVYLEVLRISGLRPDECISIEDSRAGVTAAVAAGLPCLAVTNDYTRGHDLSAASYVAGSFEEPGVSRHLLRTLQSHRGL